MSSEGVELGKALGKLIDELDRELMLAIVTGNPEEVVNVISKAHDLLLARTAKKLKVLLGPLNVRQYLGNLWVDKRIKVRQLADEIQKVIDNTKT